MQSAIISIEEIRKSGSILSPQYYLNFNPLIKEALKEAKLPSSSTGWVDLLDYRTANFLHGVLKSRREFKKLQEQIRLITETEQV